MHVIRTDPANDDTHYVVPQVEFVYPLTGDWNAPRTMILDPATCFTDVISQSYLYEPGLVVSEQFRRRLADFDVQAHRWSPIDMRCESQTRRYWWLEMQARLETRLDYGASRFVIESRDRPREIVEVTDAVHLANLARHLVETLTGELKAEAITFLPGQPSLDLFVLQLTTETFYAADRLAASLGSMTGIELLAVDTEVAYR